MYTQTTIISIFFIDKNELMNHMFNYYTYKFPHLRFYSKLNCFNIFLYFFNHYDQYIQYRYRIKKYHIIGYLCNLKN